MERFNWQLQSVEWNKIYISISLCVQGESETSHSETYTCMWNLPPLCRRFKTLSLVKKLWRNFYPAVIATMKFVFSENLALDFRPALCVLL